MDLWIRSQDKLTLRRCNSLKIEKWENKYAIVEQATVYGTYKTKERSTEILNDICGLLSGIPTKYGNAEVTPIISVYVMPEDIEETDNHIPHMD